MTEILETISSLQRRALLGDPAVLRQCDRRGAFSFIEDMMKRVARPGLIYTITRRPFSQRAIESPSRDRDSFDPDSNLVSVELSMEFVDERSGVSETRSVQMQASVLLADAFSVQAWRGAVEATARRLLDLAINGCAHRDPEWRRVERSSDNCSIKGKDIMCACGMFVNIVVESVWVTSGDFFQNRTHVKWVAHPALQGPAKKAAAG